MLTPPRATYRLQLRGGMDFARPRRLVPYLARLRSATSTSRPRSWRAPGLDPRLRRGRPQPARPALGGEAGFMSLRRALEQHGLGLILDIVPNHMGIGRENAWWWDVLEHGRASRYAGFFDIDFAADPDGKLVLPVLGGPLDEVIGRGELRWCRAIRRQAAAGLLRRALPARTGNTAGPFRDVAGRPALPADPLAGGRRAPQLSALLQHRPASPGCGWRSPRCSRPATG